ncbi:ribosome modulation factor [Methylobacterium haplocladii]|uniref:ribosome modulation factor n=1 Tax=Methylobacterium haplocladii TaxID=1176176 RepID=UPI0011BDF31A|nr:hypothetical protein [Methylobacterium haplocladii]
MTGVADPKTDASAEGARARAHGRPKDSCRYAAGSPERRSWLEGYDGLPADRAPDQPPENG